ncbi:hypothetical protein MJO28_006828 [Puccinia striiformis f. sp. tritici]|uniref:Uncharacterized protein n=1 Tax=Puccinia striiformis f. sp. tritici TaxID=168172 RepID=A0ACC0ELK3_9BASI|nr:hypothetical protein MJO28_006828 [Puccinia striiformis f. sp. tritici]
MIDVFQHPKSLTDGRVPMIDQRSSCCFPQPPRRPLIFFGIDNPFNPAKSFAHYLSTPSKWKELKGTIRFLIASFLLSDDERSQSS